MAKKYGTFKRHLKLGSVYLAWGFRNGERYSDEAYHILIVGRHLWRVDPDTGKYHWGGGKDTEQLYYGLKIGQAPQVHYTGVHVFDSRGCELGYPEDFRGFHFLLRNKVDNISSRLYSQRWESMAKQEEGKV